MEFKNIAIVLAAGQGKRMKSSVQKQYLDMNGKPILFYAIKVVQHTVIIDEIILVTGIGGQ